MKHLEPSQRLAVVLALVVGLAGGYAVRLAFAADQKFSDADNAIQKAIALLMAAEFPIGKEKCDKARFSAIKKLDKARERITKAIDCSDTL